MTRPGPCILLSLIRPRGVTLHVDLSGLWYYQILTRIGCERLRSVSQSVCRAANTVTSSPPNLTRKVGRMFCIQDSDTYYEQLWAFLRNHLSQQQWFLLFQVPLLRLASSLSLLCFQELHQRTFSDWVLLFLLKPTKQTSCNLRMALSPAASTKSMTMHLRSRYGTPSPRQQRRPSSGARIVTALSMPGGQL